ncbi:MAG: DUF29 domain-containing protein [Sphingomonadaceae bacterium]|nr:DUF29 domain-containing protein [Sphingomonadaceae bacterium]
MNEHVTLPFLTAYDTDFFEWTQEQAARLRAGQFDHVDLENVAEEIESLGRRDRREIESQLARLIVHLLKLQSGRDRLPRADWQDTVNSARTDIELALEDSPSLRRRLPEFFVRQWITGRRQAAAALAKFGDQAGADVIAGLEEPPFTLAQVLDPDFFPGD